MHTMQRQLIIEKSKIWFSMFSACRLSMPCSVYLVSDGATDSLKKMLPARKKQENKFKIPFELPLQITEKACEVMFWRLGRQPYQEFTEIPWKRSMSSLWFAAFEW